MSDQKKIPHIFYGGVFFDKIFIEKGGALDEAKPQGFRVFQPNRFRNSPVVIGFFSWWLYEKPAFIFSLMLKNCDKLLDFFSIGILLQTLFLPWKRDEIDTTNLALDDKIRVFFMNLVSRLVGAVVRLFTIFAGLIIVVITFAFGLAVPILFIALPFLGIFLIFNSIFVS
ncbi:hypothetical protein COT77_01630 [Candidatus Berkelbacteria bacterium CG10_big_fil_rev_8_21_14_0_10_41_12]|uniref:Uncharacterized protein n=1 Tax=Candidatus Berkelbacteria bacterium CG10_big_fil_rev_8_21_14_0_10_41_12 TaxID=1974513 RepID=A0A2M6WX84_9BACT|nr:MAG: hypothetical protein COT77_01630 [Candidatus Berkelbacteria bacterium CG10_big_fil_rev_8_21_14_0_10_41_12]